MAFASSSLLENLPFPLLELICEYLAHCGSKRRSLLAFSLTSKRCYFASTRERFEKICVTACNRKTFRHDVKRLEEILDIDERMRYVRHVKVIGCISLFQDDVIIAETEYASFLQRKLFAETEESENESEEDEGDFFTPSKRFLKACHHVTIPATRKEEAARNQEWLPLARLLERIPYLQDLVYAGLHQIPTCILTALHQRHPNTRLHVHSFSLDSLPHRTCEYAFDEGWLCCLDVRSNELLPISSPCLYSITVLYSDFHHSKEALLPIISTTAPRLKHVRMWHTPLPSSHDFLHAIQMPRQAWKRTLFYHREEVTWLSGPIKPVHGLILDVLGLSNQSNSSQLRSLEIQHGVSLEVIRKLTRIVEDGGLDSLSTLALWFPLVDVQQPNIDEAAGLLLQAIPPLEELRLTGPVANRTFTMVFQRHGETLRKLRFVPAHEVPMQVAPFVISDQYIYELSTRCPNLEEVELRIVRTGGDEREMSIYRALRSIRRLKHVKLFLDCSHSSLFFGYNSFSQYFDEMLTARHIRETFVNSAVDSSLALAIFGAIFDTTSTDQLQTLKLQPLVCGYVDEDRFSYDLFSIVNWIAKSWVCTRGSGDNSGEIRVRDLEEYTGNLKVDLEEYDHGELYKRVWGELWPEENEGKGDWKENWRSFPLFSGQGKEGKGKEREEIH